MLIKQISFINSLMRQSVIDLK